MNRIVTTTPTRRTTIAFKRGKPKNKPNATKPKKKLKVKGISKLIKELDSTFSRYIRLSSANDEGMLKCYTCGHIAHYKKMHAGHYISRFYKATRWDENNVRPQCPLDNLWKHGDPVTFRENLVNELGVKSVLEMEASRKTVTKLKPEWLVEQIEIYKEKLKRIET